MPNFIQKGSISVLRLARNSTRYRLIDLDDLKHQLFLNPTMTAEELAEELTTSKALRKGGVVL